MLSEWLLVVKDKQMYELWQGGKEVRNNTFIQNIKDLPEFGK
jgi:hypothetical protein